MTFVGYGGISVRRQGVQGLHVHVGMPSRRGVLALPRGDPAVAARRARAVGELAVVRRRADRHGVEPRAGPRRAAARGRRRRPSRRTRSGRRGSSGSSRLGVTEDYTRIWWDVRPHPSSGRSRCASPTSRPTSASRRRSRRCCRRSARPRSTAALPAARARRPGRADYAQNRWAAARFGPRAELLHPDGDVGAASRPSSAPSCSSACGRRPSGSAAASCSRGSTRRLRGRPAARSRDSPQDAAADARRAVGSLTAMASSPRRSRSAASAARGASCASRRRSRAPRGSSPRTRT